MFSIMNEEAQRVVSSATLSRASSGSSSSTGEILGSIQQKLSSADQKMFGSNLYWEEENLEVSRVGSVCHDSSRGFLEPGSEVKSASSTLVDLARKLLLADQTMGLEVPLFDSSYPPPGNLNSSLLQARSTNHRFKTEICRNFKEKGTCLYGELCQFAHGKHELRRDVVRHNKYKTKLCQKYWITGYCAYGPRCNFIHDTERVQGQSNPGGQRGTPPVQTQYYKTAAEVIAAVKKTNNQLDSGDSSGSDDSGHQAAPFVFSNPYRNGGNLLGLEKFPTFYPRGFSQEIKEKNSCGPIGSGRPSGKTTTPGV